MSNTIIGPTGAEFHPEEALRYVTLIRHPGQTGELRCMQGRRINSGYFDADHPADLVHSARRCNAQGFDCFITLNPCVPDLLARANNRVREWAKETTSDAHILRRDWFILDCDPARPAGIPSTDGEHEAALAKTLAIREFTRSRGWPDPIRCDSGNGSYLIFRIDLPNDDGSKALVESALKSFGEKFTDKFVKIDLGMGNAARIVRLMGSRNCKGDSTEERPQRWARLLDIPEPIGIVTADQLRALVPQAEPKEDVFDRLVGGKGFDLKGFIDRHEIPVSRTKIEGGKSTYVLSVCPFNAEHTDDAAYIQQFPNGAIAAGCHHNGCKELAWKWQDLRAKYEGGGKTTVLSNPPSGRFALLTSAEFATAHYRLDWLVRGVLVKDQPAIWGGPKKSMKTSFLVDLALSVGTGTAFLNHFSVPTPRRVAIFSGESGRATLQETARRVAASRDIDLARADVLWGFDLPRIGLKDDLDALQGVLKDEGVELVIVDPLYLSLCGGGAEVDTKNLFAMGPVLGDFTRACLEVGATPVAAHHARKGKDRGERFEPLDLEELAYAGVQEFARQWALINRREAYREGTGQHRLWLRTGGSAGFSGLFGVDVTEGVVDDRFGGRTWGVEVCGFDEVKRASKATAKERREGERGERDEEAAGKVLKALAQGPLTRRGLRDKTGVGDTKMGHALTLLLDRGQIAKVEGDKWTHYALKPV